MIKHIFECRDRFLNDYIDGFTILEIENPSPTPTVKIPPLGFPVIQFQFGKPTNFYNRSDLQHDSLVIGQITRHILLRPEEETRLVGVDFKPYGLYNLFGVKPLMIRDGAMPARELFPPIAVDNLIGVLKQANNHEERIACTIGFLKEQAASFSQRNHGLYDALVDKMVASNGLIHLADVLGQKYNLRNLQRYFRLHIGIPPKLFLEILRHKFVLQNYFSNPSFNWKDPVLDGYFYDQSHFDRDFSRFSAEKPHTYLRMTHGMARKLV